MTLDSCSNDGHDCDNFLDAYPNCTVSEPEKVGDGKPVTVVFISQRHVAVMGAIVVSVMFQILRKSGTVCAKVVPILSPSVQWMQEIAGRVLL